MLFVYLDLVLLTNFVEKSQSLRTNEQSWIPICLPEINGNGYLQAYVANAAVELESVTSNFVVILIAVSAEPQELQNLIKGRNYLVKVTLPPFQVHVEIILIICCVFRG